jgi:hypothetical protein
MLMEKAENMDEKIFYYSHYELYYLALGLILIHSYVQ